MKYIFALALLLTLTVNVFAVEVTPAAKITAYHTVWANDGVRINL